MRGGYGTGEHPPLGERAATSGRAREHEHPQPPPATGPARHCLVEGAPSLLVEWRQAAAGWEGRVVSVLWLDGVGWGSVERWLPAAAIAPV